MNSFAASYPKLLMATLLDCSVRLLKSTFVGFIADDCKTMAAALAYYALFALPPLL